MRNLQHVASILVGWLFQLTLCFDCENVQLTQTYLNGLEKTSYGVQNFIPSVYYGGGSTKYISTDTSKTVMYSDRLCVDGATSYSPIQLYDDGTHGDDFANDGVWTRGCVHYCASEVDYSDVFGYAMESHVDDATLIVMKRSIKGKIPYERINAPLIKGAKMYASSHAFFFADVNRKFYPNYPKDSRFCDAKATNAPLSALLQIFGDAFDFASIVSLEEDKGLLSGGICKTNTWDRRFGATMDKIGSRVDNCFLSMSGVMFPRLVGISSWSQFVSASGVEVGIHELLHGVAGYEYMPPMDPDRGDGAHPPCLIDYGSLSNAVWDWKLGLPDSVKAENPDNHWSVRLFPNDDCNSCSDDKLSECCSFRYEDYPISYEEMMGTTKKISPLLLYIAGMIKRDEVEDRYYYCIGSYMGKCGTNQGKECEYTVNDSNRSRITSNYVKRFKLEDVLQKYSNGGGRFPEEKYKVVRHAAIHFSSREPTQSEIEFHTLLWRHHEIQKEPWKRNNKSKRGIYDLGYYDTWHQHTSGNSILHSRLHGISCGSNSMQVPSCGTDSNVCNGAPCGPGAVCQDLDGQPFCICREGLIGDGVECAFPSEVPKYEHIPSAHVLATGHSNLYDVKEWCFGGDVWPDYTNEDSLPPYPGGMAPYAPTSCGSTVCPVGWRCQAGQSQCLPPTGIDLCENKGFTKGQCKAVGCCKFKNGQCKAKDGTTCPKPVDPAPTCSDPKTCCHFSCSQLEKSEDGPWISQLNNCGKDCLIGISPDINGVKHGEVHLDPGYYRVNEIGYYSDDDKGPLYVEGKDMYDRCNDFCFKEKRSDKFLFKVKKNGTVGKRKCGWLQDQKTNKKKNICRKKNLGHQGYKGAADACVDTCAPFVDKNTQHSTSAKVIMKGSWRDSRSFSDMST